MVQGELFRQENSAAFEEEGPKSFLTRNRVSLTLDKLLIGLIGIVVLFALTFSFGMEQGKRSMEQKIKTMAPSAMSETPVIAGRDPQEGLVINIRQGPIRTAPTNTTPTAPIAQVPVAASPEEDAVGEGVNQTVAATENTASLPLADTASKSGHFTIQLVTYKSESQAALEINRLREKGHQGFVIPSGSYYQVCANYFASKGEATTGLRKIRSLGRYPDAYVRPVVR